MKVLDRGADTLPSGHQGVRQGGQTRHHLAIKVQVLDRGADTSPSLTIKARVLEREGGGAGGGGGDTLPFGHQGTCVRGVDT